MSWEDLQRIIGSGELDVRPSSERRFSCGVRRFAALRRFDAARVVRRIWCVRARCAPRTTTSPTRRGAAPQSRHNVPSRRACAPEAHSPRRVPQLYARYDTVGDYVLCRFFGWEARPDGEGGKLRSVAPAGFARSVRFVPNDYPYHVTPGIEHHIVWVASAAGDVSALTEAELAAEVQSHKPAKAWETLTVVNPPRLQSVTNVWHAHVFSRPRAGAPA